MLFCEKYSPHNSIATLSFYTSFKALILAISTEKLLSNNMRLLLQGKGSYAWLVTPTWHTVGMG